jgi:hypothetical protein
VNISGKWADALCLDMGVLSWLAGLHKPLSNLRYHRGPVSVGQALLSNLPFWSYD